MSDHLVPGPPTSRCELCGSKTWSKARIVRVDDQVCWVEYACRACGDTRRFPVIEVVAR